MKIYAEQRVLDEVVHRFEYAFAHHAYPGAPRFDLQRIAPGDTVKVNDIDIHVLRINHGNLPILGFRLEGWAYLTDTNDIPEETIEELMNLDILVIDTLRHQRHHSHFALGDALEMIKKIGPKKTYLIHMSHLMGPTALWEQELPPHVYPSYDGLQFDLLA